MSREAEAALRAVNASLQEQGWRLELFATRYRDQHGYRVLAVRFTFLLPLGCVVHDAFLSRPYDESLPRLAEAAQGRVARYG